MVTKLEDVAKIFQIKAQHYDEKLAPAGGGARQLYQKMNLQGYIEQCERPCTVPPVCCGVYVYSSTCLLGATVTAVVHAKPVV